MGKHYNICDRCGTKYGRLLTCDSVKSLCLKCISELELYQPKLENDKLLTWSESDELRKCFVCKKEFEVISSTAENRIFCSSGCENKEIDDLQKLVASTDDLIKLIKEDL